MADITECVFCNESLDNGLPTNKLYDKGCNTILQKAKERNETISVKKGQVVHAKCRQKYIEEFQIAKTLREKPTSQNVASPAKRRSIDGDFDFDKQCLFCKKPAIYKGRKRNYDVSKVRTDALGLHEMCKRRNDKWGNEVWSRIQYAQDLFAHDAMYHHQCDSNFRTFKNIPLAFSDFEPKGKRGRRVDPTQDAAFRSVVAFLEENDNEQITLRDLCLRMGEYLEGDDVDAYTEKHMKTRLLDMFTSDRIVISTVKGIPNVVTFKEKASYILTEFHKKQKQNDAETEKKIIIETCGKLIKSDIRDIEQSREEYPDLSLISDLKECLEVLPDSVILLLNSLFSGKDVDLTVSSLGQAMLQASRPRLLLCPLQIALGVLVHHHTGSRFLVDVLHSLGFCASYSEIQRFEANAAVHQGEDLYKQIEDLFVQFMADNADHNTRTLDGRNTFHGMGIIFSLTGSADGHFGNVPRKPIASLDPAHAAKIDIKEWKDDTKSLSIKYKALQPFLKRQDENILNEIWEISFVLNPKRPSWTGTMQMVSKGDHPGKSKIVYLPMIDLNPNDMSCIYSTLSYVCKLSYQMGVSPILTFDLPLYMKANIIVQTAPLNDDLKEIILRLGTFHAIMSFVGSIGHIMAGSGVEELLAEIYAPNTVSQMLMGKAISRALRGLYLVETAVQTKLLLMALDLPIEILNPDSDGPWSESVMLVKKARVILESIYANEEPSDGDLNILRGIKQKLTLYKRKLSEHPTSQLWIQLLEMVEMTRTLIMAERCGDWMLHLNTLQNMLPYFAASGHNNYTKGVHLYLQSMQELESKNPHVYGKFLEGYHVIRRSDRFWAGLSTDLVIEQCLMRNMKSNGGLTRGRSLSERQRAIWLLSMPQCSLVNESMQALTKVSFTTSEQHKDTRSSRVERDHSDTMKLLDYINLYDPFVIDEGLLNISTGMLADNHANPHRAKEIGEKILKKMNNARICDYTFKKADQVLTMASRNSIQCGEDQVEVDPIHLFDRLTKASSDLKSALGHELTPNPAALFDNCGNMRKPTKAALVKIEDFLHCEGPDIPTTGVRHVLDGGSLLYRVYWKSGDTYNGIAQEYVKHIEKHYEDVIVVFDGYEEPSVKDQTHQRRQKGTMDPTMLFTGDMVWKSSRTQFLKNQRNKALFLKLLASVCRENGITVIEARADADVEIALSAVRSALDKVTVLIGEDTDLLLLLCHHADPEAEDIYFKYSPTTTKDSKVWHIPSLRKKLGQNLCRDLLPLHAFFGCDTTSAIYNIGKTACIQLYKENSEFKENVSKFTSPTSLKNEIHEAGQILMARSYQGHTMTCTDLNDLRYEIYMDKKKTNTFSHPRVIPPTKSATAQHAERVYYQVQEWQMNVMDPTKWGWELQNNQYKPKTTDDAPGPPELLCKIRCCCVKSNCAGGKCTCAKLGLQCSPLCRGCKGLSCENAMREDDDEFQQLTNELFHDIWD